MGKILGSIKEAVLSQVSYGDFRLFVPGLPSQPFWKNNLT